MKGRDLALSIIKMHQQKIMAMLVDCAQEHEKSWLSRLGFIVGNATGAIYLPENITTLALDLPKKNGLSEQIIVGSRAYIGLLRAEEALTGGEEVDFGRLILSLSGAFSKLADRGSKFIFRKNRRKRSHDALTREIISAYKGLLASGKKPTAKLVFAELEKRQGHEIIDWADETVRSIEWTDDKEKCRATKWKTLQNRFTAVKKLMHEKK